MELGPANQAWWWKTCSAMGATAHQQLTHYNDYKVGEAPLALAAYCLSSIAMTIMNKYVLSGHNFQLNFFLLMVQVCLMMVGPGSF